ncbi:arginine-tRNA--protein transferase 1 [Rhizophagus irregularis]|uniref:Arginyl-tRNA--protein transferase 1 n=1 Tax=Rhizophagus irregularis TaxID=588596 RepID=A0A2N0NZP6_9GLOM|nr:arginine-tRNA--protein transferase 1 [Rhizophagus irregularis]
MSKFSLVYSHGSHSSICGYCGSNFGSSKFAITATSLNCKDYQDLVDRGWRRSGGYIYKPHMKKSCCPQYTIRLDANKFNVSKSQRKLINRFNRYIEGTYDPSNNKDNKDGDEEGDEKSKGNSQQNKSKKDTRASSGFDLVKIINEAEDRQDWKHHLRIVFEKSSFSREKYELYYKYQINIHNDDPSEVTEGGFRRFLVNSPLQFESVNNPNTPGYGSFHQCYYLDNKLIAVAVLDVLPKCISSVYFLYDPDYNFLQIGKYSALREIVMAQELYNAGLQYLHWYYMGYYIHTCQKMKYKGQYKPSDLLDPETYEWYSFDKCSALLDKHNYVSFANPPNPPNPPTENNKEYDSDDDDYVDEPPPGMLDPEKVSDKDIETIKVNYKGIIKQFGDIPELKNDGIKNRMKEYYAAVGKELAERMVYKFYY